MKVGYVRVSTLDQNPERQLQGVMVDVVYTDYASGKDTNRPKLTQLMDEYLGLKAEDELIVHSMDRLGRSVVDLKTLVAKLTSRGVKVTFIKENLTFTGNSDPMSELMLGLLGSVAEFERSMIRSRQAEGIAIAKSKGVYSRRSIKLSSSKIAQIKARIESGEKVAPIAREFEVSRQAIYDALKRPIAQ
jgi:DNA invertase Pin-like site-specific DNA recombinase